jgi:hypothetical protein
VRLEGAPTCMTFFGFCISISDYILRGGRACFGW